MSYCKTTAPLAKPNADPNAIPNMQGGPQIALVPNLADNKFNSRGAAYVPTQGKPLPASSLAYAPENPKVTFRLYPE